MGEWQIDKSLGQCCGTGKKIGPGEEYFAALVETDDGLQRRDFCGEYWQQAKPVVYCYWKTKLADPQAKKRLFVDDEVLLAFFERLATETEEEKVNFRFVLALILMRKRLIKYDSSRTENGQDIWRMRVVRDKNFVDVINPHLDENQIEQVSLQMGEILQIDL